VLVLELVKELDDAYSLIEALEHHSLPLLEVRPLCSNDQQVAVATAGPVIQSVIMLSRSRHKQD
jgi:hypothetical protein